MRMRVGLATSAAVTAITALLSSHAGSTATAATSAPPPSCTPEQATVSVERALGPDDVSLDQVAHSLDDLADAVHDDAVYDFGDDDSYNLVVDPGHPEVAADLRSDLMAMDLPVPVNVIESCISQEQLAALEQQVRDVPWPDSMRSMTTEVYEPTSQVLVMVSDKDFAETLVEEFGSRVQVSVGEVTFGGRISDDEPHYGGVRLWKASCDGSPIGNCDWICSSGFKVIINGTSNGAMTTAGHCGLNDWNYRNGLTQGQSWFMGNSARRQMETQNRTDIMLLNSPEVTYRNRIYATPNQDYRDVVDDQNPVDGETICQGGAASEEVCAIRIRDPAMSITIIWHGGYYDLDHIARGRRDDNSTIARQGDSGGPVYSKQPDGDAVIHGSYTAQGPWDPPGTVDDIDCHNEYIWDHWVESCPQIYFTKVAAIESGLDAHVAYQ